LNHFDYLLHQGWFCLVRVGVGIVDYTGIDIEYRGPGSDLRQRVLLDRREVSGLKLGGQQFASSGVDPLSDHAEWLIKANDRGLGFALDDGAGHGLPLRTECCNLG